MVGGFPKKRSGVRPVKRVFVSGSGNRMIISKDGKKVVKFFVEGNKVFPSYQGRKGARPRTQHSILWWYAECLNHKSYDRNNPYYAPKLQHFSVRPVGLLKSHARYHTVEHVQGPSVHDLVSYAMKGAKPIRFSGEKKEAESDLVERRRNLANFLKKNRKQFLEWRKSNRWRDFREELASQISRVEGDYYMNQFDARLKESDFVVEGFTNDGKLKLVLVDFR